MDRQKGAILDALEGLDTLARAVSRQESSLVDALDAMPDALRILADDRRQLTRMLTSLGEFGDVAERVVTAAHDDLAANLRDLQPTLARLSKVGQYIPEVLSVLITYPTADSVEQEYFGDYGNLALTIDVSAKSLLNTFGGIGLPTANDPRTPHRRSAEEPGEGGLLPDLPTGPPATRFAPGTTIEDLLMGALS
jgi:phospholipid/cholesterol/gamma-HCH transport system substrate-binding protein